MKLCGISGGKPEEVIHKVLTEGHNYKKQWRTLHAEQLAAYISFCKETGFSEPDERPKKCKILMETTSSKHQRATGSLVPE